jgi:hypothetical protein
MSIKSRVTGTGPISSTMSPMTVDLTFNGACFGKLNLPEVRTSPSGADVVIENQDTEVLDMAAFKAFVRSLMVDEKLVLKLDNGNCTITAFGLTAHCVYAKEVQLVGMNGPKVQMASTTASRDGISSTMTIFNPSPLEIDHGISMFEIQNDKKEALAELKGDLKIIRGDFESTMQGAIKKDVATAGTARLVGKGVEEMSWCNDTVKNIDVAFQLTPEFTALV